jgi:hypothetical protein
LNFNFLRSLKPKNPAKVFERVLVDEGKGFDLFRNLKETVKITNISPFAD